MRKVPFIPFLLTVACGDPNRIPEPAPTPPREVNVYTHRHYDTDKELFARFTAATGITVNVIQAGDDELMARMQEEGARSPCDLLITADAGRLGLAVKRGLLQPVQSTTLAENIPAPFRDPEGHWYGLTMRARVVAYHKAKVDPATIATYHDLTKPRWRKRLLVRSAENVYNQSLVASMIAHDGPEAAQRWCSGIVANLARDPKGGDTDQLLAIAEGIGDLAIVNSYYVGKLLTSDEPEKQKAREVLGIVFPVNGTHGTHVNVSGGGVAKHAPHRQEAIALLEFLSGDEAQRRFAEGNKEYPVKPGVPSAEVLNAFGTFTADTLNLAALATHNAEAVKRMEAAGWR
jgi:iron(III) transport system substrate-binding protein